MAAKHKKKGRREPNGRASRRNGDVAARGRVTEAEVMEPALDARRRHQGISLSAARDPERGSALGRLRISNDDTNKITQRQYDAGIEWQYLHRRYKGMIGANSLAPRSGLDFEPRGRDPSDPDDPIQIDKYRRVKERHKEARRAILETSPMGMMAIEMVIDDSKMPGKFIGDLRLALNALAHVFGK